MDLDTPDKLLRYLTEKGYLHDRGNLLIRPLSGGISNRSWLVERSPDVSWVIKQALPKLQVQTDWYCSPLRIHSEASALRWLGPLLPSGSVPELVFEDVENHVLAMAAVPKPHQNWKTILLQGEVHLDHVRQFGFLLGQIHRKSADKKKELLPVFNDKTFFESLRLDPYYSYTANQVPEAAEFLCQLIQSTRQYQQAFVHGDYSPKNILIHQELLVILDFEVAHFGDPTFDLGFSITHLLSKAHFLPSVRTQLFQAVYLYWDTYLHALGGVQDPEFQQRVIHHTLACLLARVAGKSRLEYFDEHHRQAQRTIVLKLIKNLPGSIPELIHQFRSLLKNEYHLEPERN